MHSSLDRASTNVCEGEQRTPQQMRFERPYRMLWRFWTGILYISCAYGVYNIYQSAPERLSGWSGVLLLALLAGFCANYHLLYLRVDNWWPMPTRRALVYFSGQLVFLALLLRYGISFTGLVYALMAHICTVLPWRRWFLPLAGCSALLLWSYGAIDGGTVHWEGVAAFGFGFALLLGMFTAFYILSQQRYELSVLVDELRDAKEQLERSAAQAEELAALRERTRLAREMHDSIGHALVVVNVKLEAAQRLYRRDAARGDTELEETRALVRQTMSDLRRSLADLRASLSDHADLPAALQRTASQITARSSLAVSLDIDPELPEIPHHASEALWRIASEALVNVERHAAAASATVSLRERDGMLVLRVADDGSGIHAADLSRPGHFGITGMRERAEALGGMLHIASANGTVIEVQVPVQAVEYSEAT